MMENKQATSATACIFIPSKIRSQNRVKSLKLMPDSCCNHSPHDTKGSRENCLLTTLKVSKDCRQHKFLQFSLQREYFSAESIKELNLHVLLIHQLKVRLTVVGSRILSIFHEKSFERSGSWRVGVTIQNLQYFNIYLVAELFAGRISFSTCTER